MSAFDISFVEAKSRTLAVAASRVVGSGGAFGTVIIVNTALNLVTKELTATPPFIGDCTTPPARNTYSGPNGVIVIERERNTDVWVGDGPVFNTPCVPTSGLKTPSTVKVLDLHTGATKAVIPTGNGMPGTVGQRRADELCYNPVSDVVLIANDDPLDNFITFIGEDSYKVLQRIKFDGTDPNGGNILANGIEQCQFNPRDGKFYLNIPNTGPASATPPGPGVVLRISAFAPFHVEAVFPVGKDYTTCGGATGMAIGPDHQIGLACSGADALIIDDRTGKQIKLLTGLGGADEMWYNPGDNHYFFGISTPGTLGVADADPPAVDTSSRPPARTRSLPTRSGTRSTCRSVATMAPQGAARRIPAARPRMCSATREVTRSAASRSTRHRTTTGAQGASAGIDCQDCRGREQSRPLSLTFEFGPCDPAPRIWRPLPRAGNFRRPCL